MLVVKPLSDGMSADMCHTLCSLDDGFRTESVKDMVNIDKKNKSCRHHRSKCGYTDFGFYRLHIRWMMNSYRCFNFKYFYLDVMHSWCICVFMHVVKYGSVLNERKPFGMLKMTLAKVMAVLQGMVKSLTAVSPNTEQDVDIVVDAIGGLENIMETGACATRLRLRLKSTSVVDKKRLTTLGAHGVVVLDNEHIQIIFGLKANMYSQIIESRLLDKSS